MSERRSDKIVAVRYSPCHCAAASFSQIYIPYNKHTQSHSRRQHWVRHARPGAPHFRRSRQDAGHRAAPSVHHISLVGGVHMLYIGMSKRIEYDKILRSMYSNWE